MIKRGFTLLEIVLVIGLLAIAFFMSRSLFTNPNQDFISSEVCINTIHGELSQFFYQATTGKEQYGSDGVPVGSIAYDITFNKMLSGSQISLYSIYDFAERPISIKEINIGNPTTTVPSCNTSKYQVILSGTQLSTTSSLRITINKNLQSTPSRSGIEICKTGTDRFDCNGGDIFDTTIEYFVCPKNGNTINMSLCKHTYSTRFDVRTQSIQSNKCLDISYDSSCKKRSSDSF